MITRQISEGGQQGKGQRVTGDWCLVEDVVGEGIEMLMIRRGHEEMGSSRYKADWRVFW